MTNKVILRIWHREFTRKGANALDSDQLSTTYPMLQIDGEFVLLPAHEFENKVTETEFLLALLNQEFVTDPEIHKIWMAADPDEDQLAELQHDMSCFEMSIRNKDIMSAMSYASLCLGNVYLIQSYSTFGLWSYQDYEIPASFIRDIASTLGLLQSDAKATTS